MHCACPRQRLPPNAQTAARDATRRNLLDTGFSLIREKGYAATRIDDICAAARVTKGAFILAKSTGDARIARDMVRHVRRYVELLFGIPAGSGGLDGSHRPHRVSLDRSRAEPAAGTDPVIHPPHDGGSP